MHQFHRLMTSLPVGALLDALAAQPSLWDEITVRQEAPGSPHHDTECIWLRGPRDITLDTVFNELRAVDYPSMHELAQAVYPLVAPVLREIGSTQLGRVLIVKLKPGGVIDPHEDTGRYAKAYSRFHLVLTSAPGNTFTCDNQTVHMQPGELWWFNHRGEHSVRNDSDTDRIHLIFDAQVPAIQVRPLSFSSCVAIGQISRLSSPAVDIFELGCQRSPCIGAFTRVCADRGDDPAARRGAVPLPRPAGLPRQLPHAHHRRCTGALP